MGAGDIYKLLTQAGMTRTGALAMLGNMAAESGLRADNAQDAVQDCSDSEYTARFNATPERCYNDGCGYGLCQWTYPTRKKGLRQFAKNWGVGVEAWDMQTMYAVYELKSEYGELWSYLCATRELGEAVGRICREYERPAVNNIAQRIAAAERIEAELGINEEHCRVERDMAMLILQALLAAEGYELEITGRKDSRTLEALRRYAQSMGA